VLYDSGVNTTRAASIASTADITLIFVATDSGEGTDRTSLHLDGIPYSTAGRFTPEASSDYLIESVAEKAKNVVVVMVHPGAVMTPWRGKVSSIIAAFLPGQEYGGAVTDLLWGVSAPSARLPLTLPASESDLGWSQEQYPGIPKPDVRTKDGWITHTTYSEKLEIGYRYYDAHEIQPAYPFGHGLSYTNFNYSNIKASADSVSFTLSNVGQRDGTEVVQLYLGFPKDAGEPPKQLKAFQKVFLSKGASKDVTLQLTKRSLSIWDASSHGWHVQQGTFTCMVGASSRDIRLTTTFKGSGSMALVV